jgi:quercetin dioxygenase-like cupin family protein
MFPLEEDAMMRAVLLSAAALLLPFASSAQETKSAKTHAAQTVTVVLPDAVAWGPAPAVLPPGATASVLEGDPTKAQAFTMRLRMPDGYKIPPHYHPAMEHVTVVSGALKVGMSDRFDEAQMKTLPAGSFAAIPPRMHHYAMAKGETVLQLHGIGPWRIVYLNKADDPRTKTVPR